MIVAASAIMAGSLKALDIQGHRGARGLAPENTLAGFARALAIGVTTLEMDCAVTKDDVVVVSHDRSLDPDLVRGPDGQWLTGAGPLIRDLTYEKLQRYDVGRINPASAYAKRWPEQQPLDGVRIPKLADVFSLVRKSGNNEVRFNIETKISPLAPAETVAPEVFARLLLAAIRAAGMADRTSIQSFDWRTLAAVQAKAPAIPTVYLTTVSGFMDNIQADRSASPWTAGHHVSRHGGSIPRMVKIAGGAVWSPYYGDLVPAAVHEARVLGLKIVPWTVNEPGDMRRLIEWGVDGIISDRPDILRRVGAEMDVVLPPATPVTL